MWLLSWLAIGGLFAPLALAQAPKAPGSADEALRHQERERALRERQETRPDVRLPRGAPASADRLPEEESPCFPIDHVRLTGESAAHFAFALQALAEDESSLTGPCLGVAGINAVLGRVQNNIIERGYITTRVLAPPQDLTHRELVLTVIPGSIRSVRFESGDTAPGLRRHALPAESGDLLNLRDIEQALENFRGVPTANADVRIEPAAEPGESDILVQYRQDFPLRLTVSLDDAGAKATGRYQASALVSYDNLLTLNDVLYASVTNNIGDRTPTRGTRSYSAHYSVPYGYWRVTLSANRYRYHQKVAGAFQNYRYSGTSTGTEARLARLIYRDATRKTIVSMRGYTRASNNFIDDTEVEVQRRRMAGWEAALSHREFIANAVLDLTLSYRRGTGAFGALRAPEEDFGEGTARPRIIRAEGSWELPFALGTPRLNYRGTWRAQWHRTPLVPQDRFAIGGRYTVRGFDGENVLSGERGWLLRNELGLLLAGGSRELYLGLDHGRIGGPSSEMQVGRDLTGAVVGLRGTGKRWSYDIFSGWPIHRPDRFITANPTAGFSLAWTY